MAGRNGVKNPFKVLGVSPSSSFETIQKKFTELALRFHPDVHRHQQEGKAVDASAETFVRIRQAFEHIRKTRNGPQQSTGPTNTPSNSPLKQQSAHNNYRFSEQDFLNYFAEQTGLRLSSAQRREMIHLYRNRPQGYYAGHSWDLARRLSFEQDSYLRRMQEHQQQQDDDDDSGRNSVNSNVDFDEPTGSSDVQADKLRRKRRRR